VRRLQDFHDKIVRKVPNQLLLQRRVPEIWVEEAQENVQTPHLPSRNRGRAPNPPQGDGPPEYVHTEKWGWGWPNQRRAGVPDCWSSLLLIT